MGAEQEQWQHVPGYEDRYMVSDIGRVKSLYKAKVLSPTRLPSGHLSIALYRRGAVKHVLVHRLVMLTFRGEALPHHTCVRHLNGIPDDNRLANLAYGDDAANAADRIRHGACRSGEASASIRVAREAVVAIRELVYETGGAICRSSVAKVFGVATSYVSAVVSNRYRPDAGGPACADLPTWPETVKLGTGYSREKSTHLAKVKRSSMGQIRLSIPLPELKQEELWQWVPGTNKKYKVSDHGNIISHARRKPKQLRSQTDCSGYKRVSLRLNGKSARRSVHRLVLLSFVGDPPEGYQACHRNGVRDDNRLENLYWGSVAANNRDKIAHGSTRRGAANHTAVLTEEQVVKIRELYATGQYTARELATTHGMSKAPVVALLSGRTWKDAGGPIGVKIPRPNDQKLTPEDARQIRELYTTGQYKQKDLAVQFTVDQSVISNIVRGKVYRDAGGPDCAQVNPKPSYDVGHETAVAIREEYTQSRANTPDALAAKHGISRSLVLKITQSKGKWAYLGEPVHWPRGVTLEQAQQIMNDWAVGRFETKTALARHYGWEPSVVSRIVLRKDRFSGLTDPTEQPQPC